MGLRTMSMTARLQNTNESCIEVALGFREPGATFLSLIDDMRSTKQTRRIQR